jgi:hypothetical protein
MIATTDWRLRDQTKYLQNAVVLWKAYKPSRESWSHDHCEFCWRKFVEGEGPGDLHRGYCTEDEYHWICPQCFEDFKEMFGLTVATD